MRFRLDVDVRKAILIGYVTTWASCTLADHRLRCYLPFAHPGVSSETAEVIKTRIGQFLQRFVFSPLLTMIRRTEDSIRTGEQQTFADAWWLLQLYLPFPRQSFMRKWRLDPQDLRSPQAMGFDVDKMRSEKAADHVRQEFRGLPEDPLALTIFLAGPVEDGDPASLIGPALFVQPIELQRLNDSGYVAYRRRVLDDWAVLVRRSVADPEHHRRVRRDFRRGLRSDDPDRERLLHFDAIDTYHHALEMGFREVYRAERTRLTPPERRLFQLLYFRHPTCYPLLLGFNEGLVDGFLHLDSKLERRLFHHLLFKTSPEIPRADEELLHAWKAYLKVYPFAVELRESAYRERREERAEREDFERGLLVSAEQPLPNAHNLTFRDVIADQDPGPAVRNIERLMRMWLRGALPSLIREYCVEDARYLLPQLEEAPPTQQELAQRFGVSQQAVSKGRARAMARLLDGLRREGLERGDLL